MLCLSRHLSHDAVASPAIRDYGADALRERRLSAECRLEIQAKCPKWCTTPAPKRQRLFRG